MVMEAEVPTSVRLRRAGFDKCGYNPRERKWKVGCTKCKALVINGVPCHELNCSNFVKAKNRGFK
jgi:hypothetical protein